MMIKTLILVCATALSPRECSSDTAAAVVRGPLVQSIATCGMHGQAYLAQTALARYLDGEHYLHLLCGPERPGR